jgi:hypothetical protein
MEDQMRKFLLTTCILLVSLPAFAEDWSKEEAAAGMKRIEMTRHVPAGKQRTLSSILFLNPDCTVIEDWEAVVTKEPNHGTVAIEAAERFPTYAKENVRSKCNEKKMRMQVINYRAAVGYAGTDTFEVQLLHPNGLAEQHIYTIKVIDVGTKNKGRADLRP